jgi:DNA-binding NarL/FixJ family response regulator
LSVIEQTPIIKEKYSDSKVLVLTMDDSKSTVTEIINAEAEGYILKNSDKKELINAILRIMDKATYYSSSILQIMGSLVRDTKKQTQPVFPALESLSEREIDVVKLICEELTSDEIADKLFIAKATVDVHRKNILRKLEAKNSVSIYKFALDSGLIKNK